eukprot:TRINITY_DN2116_c0_g1_i7.p2 TRINITY_DN2116_c0_g1~~TRINITY_DN2116_c0_g1_i7.p2  ORF type:complete len:116 (+),score=13.60 TRINITY_DN2116_c0_g1_i7:246-593(+)
MRLQQSEGNPEKIFSLRDAKNTHLACLQESTSADLVRNATFSFVLNRIRKMSKGQKSSSLSPCFKNTLEPSSINFQQLVTLWASAAQKSGDLPRAFFALTSHPIETYFTRLSVCI